MDKKEGLRMPKSELVKDVHYYINEHGYWVFTAHYHQQRGYCCKSGCKHCPYGFSKK
jgi:hypothetical protein